MKPETLKQVLNEPSLNAIDRHFAGFIERLSGGNNPELALAAAILSFHGNKGNICVYLPEIAGKDFPPQAEASVQTIRCPALNDWVKRLRATSVVGRPGDFQPLILDDANRLYLHRYWKYEHDLAQAVLERADSPVLGVDWKLAHDGLARLFPKAEAGVVDWQKVAAFAALRKNFCVISGGPGTGKTHTVAKILALLLEQAGDTALRIKLAAPTGKAAARLQESLQRENSKLEGDIRLKARLPEDASTIHRLLGAVPGSSTFRHDAENPVAADVVIVDEASMVGLPLMAKLVSAIPENARLILLGDKDQLASVEAGSVLGDICNAGPGAGFSGAFADEYKALTGEEIKAKDGPANHPLADCIVELQKNYRFGNESRIHQLSFAVNHGDAAAALSVLGQPTIRGGPVSWKLLPVASGLKAALKPMVLEYFSPCFQSSDPETIQQALGKFRMLCAVRKGHFGVETINRLVEEILREADLIRTDSNWYAGRPVMITRNDYNVRLFNGDIGVALPDANGALRVFFRSEDEGIRPVSPLRLPEHETVYAMTVHKSQGSEFENVLLVLPDRDSPILTRELIYTGLTRASGGVQLWLREEIFRTAITRRVARASGLGDAMWGRPA